MGNELLTAGTQPGNGRREALSKGQDHNAQAPQRQQRGVHEAVQPYGRQDGGGCGQIPAGIHHRLASVASSGEALGV